jgi:hypothetical protein
MMVTLPHHLPRQLARLDRGGPADPVRVGPLPGQRSAGGRLPGDAPGEPATPVRRVREEVRDGVVVIAFSATASTGVALMLLLLARLAG